MKNYRIVLHDFLRSVEMNISNHSFQKKYWRITGYSKSRFDKIFSEKYYMTPRRYIILRRLTHAGIKVKFSSDEIRDIAFDYGYDHLSAFSRDFKSVYRMSPTEYRLSNMEISPQKTELDMSMSFANFPFKFRDPVDEFFAKGVLLSEWLKKPYSERIASYSNNNQMVLFEIFKNIAFEILTNGSSISKHKAQYEYNNIGPYEVKLLIWIIMEKYDSSTNSVDFISANEISNIICCRIDECNRIAENLSACFAMVCEKEADGELGYFCTSSIFEESSRFDYKYYQFSLSRTFSKIFAQSQNAMVDLWHTSNL